MSVRCMDDLSECAKTIILLSMFTDRECPFRESSYQDHLPSPPLLYLTSFSLVLVVTDEPHPVPASHMSLSVCPFFRVLRPKLQRSRETMSKVSQHRQGYRTEKAFCKY